MKTIHTSARLAFAGAAVLVSVLVHDALFEGMSASASASTMESSSSSSESTSSSGMDIGVTDGMRQVRQGGALMYAVTVMQKEQEQKTVDVVLHLPPYVSTASPENGGRYAEGVITWEDVTLFRNQGITLTAMINLHGTVPEGTILVARADAGGMQAADTTIVSTHAGSSASIGTFDVYVTDNRDSAKPGEKLQYTAVVRNVSNLQQSTDVEIRVSPLTEITDIQPATTYESTLLQWKNVSLGAGQVHAITFNGTVRRNAGEQALISVEIRAGTAHARDGTVVRTTKEAISSSTSSPAVSSAGVPNFERKSVFFTKTAETQEILPGAEIRYTLYVQNVLLNVIDDASITDRFDASLLQVIDAGGAAIIGPGEMQWRLPRLMPGETWQQNYTLVVAEDVPHGTIIGNIATITGQDVSQATLNEKVTVVKTGVVDNLPSTGAPFDLFILLLSMPVAAACTRAQKARMRV